MSAHPRNIQNITNDKLNEKEGTVDKKTPVVKPTALNESKKLNPGPIKKENRIESFKKYIFKHPLEIPVVNMQTNKGQGGWKKKYSVNINGTIGDRLKKRLNKCK